MLMSPLKQIAIPVIPFFSIYDKEGVESQTKPRFTTTFYRLVYKSKEPVFNPDQATFMDFQLNKRQYPLYVCAANFNHRSFIRIYIVFTPALTKRNTNRRLSNTLKT
jgi:lycopene beta-cyclase